MSRMSDDPASEGDTAARRSGGQARRSVGRGRRLARTLAFQTLYEVDLAHHRPSEVYRRLANERAIDEETDTYARQLIAGVLRNRQHLDCIIQEKAPAWPLQQMSVIDRNILRLGLYECLYEHATVPTKVAINEAVELAKTFGSESSARFVNGVLGRVIESLPAAPGKPREQPNQD